MGPVVAALQLPAAFVLEAVVVSAERGEVVLTGGAAVRPGHPVVEVTALGRLAAPGKDTGGVDGLAASALAVGGPPPGGAAAFDPVAVDDGEAPFAAALGGSDLAGDVGDHRSPTGQLGGSFVQPDEGLRGRPGCR